ncbi:phage tail protein [Chondrinema litorale]|uniref:phage tail protein n=1 Tax=Chondrinema litorale TaxID=2994555 RepID=UPI002542E2FB|nr:phage tail protein [Chondrinema litorale]UZR98484.1 phage tail protein [Chondrinema litorale]
MKKTILIFFILISQLVYAQNEDKGFSFQGYARDFEGAALSNQNITVKFSIYPEGQSTQYEEEQTVKTDAYGVFHAVVGSVKPTDFEKVNFSVYSYWLKVEVRAYGSSYVEISNTELLSVPYAKSASNGVPPGSILPFGGVKSNIPPGYLPCDGSLVNKSDYPNLYAAIGSAWGENGGSFNVPDLRGYFMRGVSENTTNDPDKDSRTSKNGGNTGNNVGSYQNDLVVSHQHSYNGTTSTNGDHQHTTKLGIEGDDSGSGGASSEWVTYEGGLTENKPTTTNGSHSHTYSGNTDNAGGNETRPKNAYVWFMIKY